ncbi:MAG: hypothetical protein ACR2HR_13215 [Euzebya sp.]
MAAALNLLIPPRCLACKRVGIEPLCHDCLHDLEPDEEGHELAPGVVAVSVYVYADPLATAIKRVKTDALRAGARGLATLLEPHVPPKTPRTWVPAPPRRRRRRGLDLPEILAGPAARALLVNTRTRIDQDRLDARGRRRSAVGSYAATATVPRAVVLIDDVRATGATLLAAATALRRAGAERVLALTLAASPGPPSVVQDHGLSTGSARWS